MAEDIKYFLKRFFLANETNICLPGGGFIKKSNYLLEKNNYFQFLTTYGYRFWYVINSSPPNTNTSVLAMLISRKFNLN